MAIDNRVTRLTGTRYPIIQAPMGWIARSQLASAVSNAGGLGIIETSSGELDNIKREVQLMRELTDKPISHLVLTHYHAVRVLGASAYGAREVIMSDTARAMVVERGQEDWDSEFQRFPRLFQGHESIPGLTYPTTTFSDRLTVYLGKRRVDIMHLGRAHTAGDAVVHVPDQNVMFTGDIVEYHSACYCGDGHFADWSDTLDNIAWYDVDAIAPGRGDALIGKEMVHAAIENTRDFVTSTYRPVQRVAAQLRMALLNRMANRM